MKSVVNGVTTYYPSTAYQEEGTKITKYYSLGGQRVAMRANGVLTWLVTDHLGSTNVTANADGSLQSEMRYQAFGEIRYTNGITPTDYRYTGQLQQAETGLYFYNARWYDPQLGRFIQADTIVPNALNPKEYDRFAYALNNPIKFIDPSGHQACWDDNRGDPGCSGYVPTAQGLVSQTVYQQQTGYPGGNISNTTNNAGGGNAKMPTSIPTFTVGQGYMQGWENFGSAVSTIQNSNAGWGNQVGSGLYIAGWGGMHVALAGGGSVIVCAMVSTACAGALGIGSYLSADGDPFNEIQTIGATGRIGEAFLRQLGGKSQYFSTSQGARIVDMYANLIAYESKVGYVPLTNRVSIQVAKDVELLITNQVMSVNWVFFQSPLTGRIGPSTPLLHLLEQNGIGIFYGNP